MNQVEYYSKRQIQQLGISMLEVLLAAFVIFIVLASTLGAYFLSVVQGAREIIDTDSKAITDSLQDAIRAGLYANLAQDQRSFWFDFEGVRTWCPLPQPGQPAVSLPDYEEDINGNGAADFVSGPDIDWDQDGVLDSPAFAIPPRGTPEALFSAVGTASQIYDGLNNDGDPIVDDYARYIIPIGLLAFVEEGSFIADPTGGQIVFASSGIALWHVFPPLDENTNNDFVAGVPQIPTTSANPPVEAALLRNRIPGTPFISPNNGGQYFPDTFEDLNGDGQITRGAYDVDSGGVYPAFESTEDFNLNGFLDVPVRATFPGSVYYHTYYGPPVAGGAILPADPLSMGLAVNPTPPGMVSDMPYSALHFIYADQRNTARDFGYSLQIQRVASQAGQSQGYGRAKGSVYRFTIFLYNGYAQALQQFQAGNAPQPIRQTAFEVEIQ